MFRYCIFTVNVIRKKLQKYCTVCNLGEKRIGRENYTIRKRLQLLARRHRDWNKRENHRGEKEQKLKECICPLSWSVHHNFARDGTT
jgi:hypothetical protein